MNIIIAIALILSFCLGLLVALLSVLQDLFACSAHQPPSMPAPERFELGLDRHTDLSRTSQTMTG